MRRNTHVRRVSIRESASNPFPTPITLARPLGPALLAVEIFWCLGIWGFKGNRPLFGPPFGEAPQPAGSYTKHAGAMPIDRNRTKSNKTEQKSIWGVVMRVLILILLLIACAAPPFVKRQFGHYGCRSSSTTRFAARTIQRAVAVCPNPTVSQPLPILKTHFAPSMNVHNHKLSCNPRGLMPLPKLEVSGNFWKSSNSAASCQRLTTTRRSVVQFSKGGPLAKPETRNQKRSRFLCSCIPYRALGFRNPFVIRGCVILSFHEVARSLKY
jgi:hypothetical protein